MSGLWEALFVYGLFIYTASSQQIYLNENNECNPNEQTILTLNEKIDSLRQENARIKKDFDQLVTFLKKNISTTEEDLKSSLLKIITDGFNLKKDCYDLYINGKTKSGVYEINPAGVCKINSFGIESRTSVFCNGGWTAIQKRVSGSVSFNRTWKEYKTGFGNSNDSYWIGNDVIHKLSRGRNTSLYVSIKLRNGRKLYKLYNQFSVADETNKYRLLLGGPATGTLGDAMLNTGTSDTDLSGMAFSTLDRDHDRYPGNCATDNGGGWWYNRCYSANLNGPWSQSGLAWYPPLTNGSDITETLMMIKPH